MRTEAEIREEIARLEALAGLPETRGNPFALALYSGKLLALKWVLENS